MSNEPKQLYDDNPKVKPSEKLPKIRNFGEGAIDEYTKTDLGDLNRERSRPYTDESTGLKVYPGTTYSKTPEEFNNEIEDLKDQRKRWEAGLELSAKKQKILSEIDALDKSKVETPPSEMLSLLTQETHLKNQNILLDKQLLELAPKSYDKEPLSTEEKITQPIYDAYNVFNGLLKKGIFWDKQVDTTEYDKSLERMAETPGAFFKGFNQMLGGGFQSIAILGHAWDKFFGNKYDLEDNPTFKLGKYISELGGEIEDPNYLQQLFQAQGSMAGFLLGGEILAPIKAAVPTSQLWSQIFSSSGRVALVGGLTQFPDEYLKALKMGASQSQAMWIGALNFVGGMTEALPIEAFLEKLTASTGQKFLWQKALKDASIQGTEEGLQEMFQQLLANASAKQIYDANRELLQGVGDGGAIGFLSGFLMSGSIGVKQVVQEIKEETELGKQYFALQKEAYERAYGNLSEYSKFAFNKIQELGKNKVVKSTNEEVKDDENFFHKSEKKQDLTDDERVNYSNFVIIPKSSPLADGDTIGINFESTLHKLSSEGQVGAASPHYQFLSQMFGGQNVTEVLPRGTLKGNNFMVKIDPDRQARMSGEISDADYFDLVYETMWNLSNEIGHPANSNVNLGNFRVFIDGKEYTFSEFNLNFSHKGTPRTYTPENITSLKPNQVFVFGSNTEGRHGLGAAKLAKDKFGAKYGQSKGIQGQSYGVITKDLSGKDVSLENIADEIYDLNNFAKSNPSKEFLVTKLGTGLAGHNVESIKDIWRELQSNEGVSGNIVLPKEFEVRDEVVSEKDNKVIDIDSALDEVVRGSNNPMLRALAEKLKHRIDIPVFFKDIPNEYGHYSPLEKNIVISNFAPNKDETIIHESIHAFTIDGIISEDSPYHNKSLYDKDFKDKIQKIYDAVMLSGFILPDVVMSPSHIADKFGNIAINSKDNGLIEFISYGLTDPISRNILSKVYVGKTGKTAWREFVNAVWNYIGKLLNLKGSDFSESALNNLIVAVSEHVDKKFPNKEQTKVLIEEMKKQVQQANLSELTAPVATVFSDSVPRTFDQTSGVDAKTEALDEQDDEEVYNGMSTSAITTEFTNKDGSQIYASAEKMYADMLDIYKMALAQEKDATDNLGIDERALQIFKDKYQDIAVEKETKGNSFSFLENVFYSMKNKRVHKVATLEVNSSGRIHLVQHESVYPTGINKQSSVIYDKRFYEMIGEQVSKVLGSKVQIHELKNYKDFIDKQNKEREEKAKAVGDYNYEHYKMQDIMNEVYREGFAVMPNKNEVLLVKISSILSKEEIAQVLSNKQNISDAVKISTFVFNKFWGNAFNPTAEYQPITQAALLKRMANLAGKAPNNLITPDLRKMLSTNPRYSMYLDGDKVMVRTVQLDTKDLPPYLIKHLKETLGDWYKPELIGDGAVFSLPKVHNFQNLMNGVPYNKWGRLNKYKTFTVGEQLLKCADQKAFKFSPLYDWMLWNNIGKVVLTSSRKIKYGQESINWATITGEKQEDGSIKKIAVKDSQIFTYDMRQDAFQSSHGEVKTESKGLMSSFVTTMLSSYMSPEVKQILKNHLKGHVSILKTQTLDNLDSFDFIKQSLTKFMKEQEDLFESFEQQWIQSEIKKDSKFASVLTAIEYFKQNVLSKKIQNTLQHEEINGSLPALAADMGEIGGYKNYFIKQYLKKNPEASLEEAETEASTYFDKYGFIKKGYCVLDEQTFKKLGEPENLIIGCNPPASIADIRAIKVALVVPTDNYGDHKVSANMISVNIMQFQALSGKDFDIDKIPVVNPKSTEMKALWDFLDKLDPDTELQRFAKEFETWNVNDEFEEPENRIDAIEKMVNIPVLKGKIDKPLAHVIKLFGINPTLNNLDITNPEHFVQLADRLSDNFIGRLYNVRLIYTAMLEKGGKVEYDTYDNNQKPVHIEVSTNLKKTTYNKALLYYLTNYSLDWLSDQKILSFKYDPAVLNHILYKVTINGKESKNALQVNKYVQKMYETYLKPSRMLLRRPENPDVKIKSYAELKAQLLDAFHTLFDKDMNEVDNIFDGTTVIQAARDFISSFMDSKVGVMGLHPKDVTRMYSNLKKELVPDGDLFNQERELIKWGSPMSHLAKLMNRYRDIGYFTPQFVIETKDVGKTMANNSEGGLAEIHLYSKSLRDANIMPSTHNLFNELLNDYFEKDIALTKKTGQIVGATIASTGSKLQRLYIINKNERNELTFTIEDRDGGKLTKSTVYKTWSEMLQNQGSFPIFEIINKMSKDAVKSFTEGLGRIFVFKGNSRLKQYTSDKMFDIYKNVAEEMNGASKVGQRLFFKLGTGLYDSSQWSPEGEKSDEKTKYGERYRLTIFQDSKSITNSDRDGRQNIKIPNISPYMLYLQKASEVNRVAKDLYEEVLGSVVKTALNEHQDKLDKMRDGNMLPFYFFHRPLVIESVAPKDALDAKKSDIQTVAKSIMSNLPKSIRDWQVIQFWNSNNQGTKVSKNNLTDKHYQFYIDNMVRSYFNLEPIYRGSKKYNAQLDVYKMLEKVTSDSEGKYNVVSQFIGKSMPSQFMIRAFSDRNINLMPNEKIIYIHNGQFHYINPFDIVSSFGETSARIDTNQIVSGAMIAQEITRKINNGFNDNQQIYESNMSNLRAIWTQDNAFLHEQQKADWWEGFGFKEMIANIAEGIDDNKVLQGMNFAFEKINYKDTQYEIATINDKDNMTVNFNIKSLTELARNILTDKGLLTDKSKTIFNNNFNAIQIRTVMGAIAQRWLYDYYAEIQIQKHITDLTFLSKYVNRLSSETILESQALIRDFLGRAKNMLKQIELMKNEMRSLNRFYMPHMFSSEQKFKEALIIYFTKKGVPDVMKEVNAQLAKSADEANYMGNVKENITHLNFLERKFGTLELYRKDENVTQDYFSTMNLMFRQRMLTIYEEVNKEWLREDNKFMNDELRWQSAILKTQNAVYRSVQNINQLDKRDFISFRKSKTYDIVYGEVVSVDKKNNTILIKELSGDATNTYKYNEIANVRVMSGIVASKQLRMFCYKMFGKDYTFQQVDTAFRMIVSMRNKALLGTKFYYALRNRFGNNQMVKAMYGTENVKDTKSKMDENYFTLAEKELDKLQSLVSIDSIDSESTITEQEKEVWKLLLNEATAFFGGVNQIMGRIGFTADVASAVDKDFSQYLIESNQQWENVRLELEPLLKIVNGSKSDIGWDERKYIDAQKLFVRKIFTKGGFMRNFYNKYHLDSPIALLNKFFGKGTYNVSPKKAEELNRKTTILTAVMAFTDVFDLSEFTEEEQTMMKPIILELSKTVYEQGIKLVDFLYQPGLDLSHYDSTMGGHILLQFSHFNNSLTSTYVDRWIQASKQMKMFGTVTVGRVMKNNELWYEARLLNPVTGEVTLKHFKQFNDLRRAMSMTWRSFIFGIIDLIAAAFTKEVIGYGAGSIAGTLAQYLFINAIGDGIGISLIKGLTTGLSYLIQSSINQSPSEPPDDDEDKINKILGIIVGYSEDEYVAWEVKKIKESQPGFYRSGETEEMLRRSYQRRASRQYVEGIPIMGVGLGDLYTLLMSAFISEGEFDNSMELLQSSLTTIIPGMSIVVPIIQSIKPDFAWRSDPYYSAKADYKDAHSQDLKLQKIATKNIERIRDESILSIGDSTIFQTTDAKTMIQMMQEFQSTLKFDENEGAKTLERVHQLEGMYTGTQQEKDFNTVLHLLLNEDARQVLPTEQYNMILKNFNRVYEVPIEIQIPPKSEEEEAYNYDEPVDGNSNYDLSPKEKKAIQNFVGDSGKPGPSVNSPLSKEQQKRKEKVENQPNVLDQVEKRIKKFKSIGRQFERTETEDEQDNTGLGEVESEKDTQGP